MVKIIRMTKKEYDKYINSMLVDEEDKDNLWVYPYAEIDYLMDLSDDFNTDFTFAYTGDGNLYKMI